MQKRGDGAEGRTAHGIRISNLRGLRRQPRRGGGNLRRKWGSDAEQFGRERRRTGESDTRGPGLGAKGRSAEGPAPCPPAPSSPSLSPSPSPERRPPLRRSQQLTSPATQGGGSPRNSQRQTRGERTHTHKGEKARMSGEGPDGHQPEETRGAREAAERNALRARLLVGERRRDDCGHHGLLVILAPGGKGRSVRGARPGPAGGTSGAGGGGCVVPLRQMRERGREKEGKPPG